MDYIKRRKSLLNLFPILINLTLYTSFLVACQGFSQTNQDQVTPSPIIEQQKKTPTAQQTQTPTPQPTSQFQVETADLQGISLTFWHTWNGAGGETISRLITDFNQNNEWKIQVKGVYQGGVDEMGEVVYNAINTGGFPQIVMGYPYQVAYWNSARKLTININAYRADAVWGLSQTEEADYYPVFQSQAQIADQWGFPAQRTAQFLIYNKTWAKELGYNSAPQTPADVKSQACAANKAMLEDDEKENDTTGGLVLTNSYPTSLGWMYAFGGQVVTENGSGYQFNTPEVKETFTFLRSLFEGRCAWVSNNIPPVDEFSKRQGLFISGNLDTLGVLSTAMALANNDDEWEIIPFPSPDEAPVIVVYGPDYYILESNPAEQLASWLFIKFLSMPENQAKLIAASGKLPLQASGLQALDTSNLAQPQWQDVVDLLPNARAEPALPSWGAVRWAVGDATSQLFAWYFEADQIPAVVKLLNETAASLHKKNQ